MSISKEEMHIVSNLARINLNENEIQTTIDTLNGVLNMIDQIKEIRTDHIDPLHHPLEVTQRLREDIPVNENKRTLLQSCAPETERGLYLVPKVID